MERVLVAGAHGTTGKKIVQLLKSSQYFEPIAMVRKGVQVNEFKAQNVETVLGNLEEDVSHTVKSIDKVIFAAGSGGKKLKAVDQDGAKKLIDASKQGNVTKFVMLSSMGADNPQVQNELQDYLMAKHNADEYLKSSGINFTIVRPGSLNDEKGTGKIKLSRSLAQTGEISRDDVAQTLVRCLHDDAVNWQIFEILQGDLLIGKALDSIPQH